MSAIIQYYCYNHADIVPTNEINQHIVDNPEHTICEIITDHSNNDPQITIHVDVPEDPNIPVGNINASQLLSIPIDDTNIAHGKVLKYDQPSNTLVYSDDIISAIDHGALTGLDDDDHTQYLNNARGDARYYTKGQLDSGVLDARYYTETEVNNLLSTKANVSHTHLAMDVTDFQSSVSNNATVVANLAHTTLTNNPHNTSIANLGSGTLSQLNNIISDANLDEAGTPRPVLVYIQATEPSLPSTHDVAIWQDTSDSNRVWWLFLRAPGDQVKVEMA